MDLHALAMDDEHAVARDLEGLRIALRDESRGV
jgi:hypothetical protein